MDVSSSLLEEPLLSPLLDRRVPPCPLLEPLPPPPHYLFDSLKETAVMKCGHTMHSECYQEMIKRDKYCCPICSKSVIDMSTMWKRIDEEIEAIVVPDDYRLRKLVQGCGLICGKAFGGRAYSSYT